MTRAADRLRGVVALLMWAGMVLGAPGVTIKGALVLAPSLVARAVAPGRADALLTGGLAVDLVATAAGAYQRWIWWDDLAHVVLPALLVPVAAAALVRAGRRSSPARSWAAVVVVALAWELVELTCDATLGTHFNLGVADSALDVACGMLGAGAGAWLLPRARRGRRRAPARRGVRARPAGGRA